MQSINRVFFKCLFLALIFLSNRSEASRWLLPNLQGVKSRISGPNCFNGALAGKGYEQFLGYNHQVVYLFYLKSFCSKREGAAEPGDLLAVYRNGFLDHGAIAVDEEKIFEKPSKSGINSNQIDGTYNIYTKAESQQFSSCKEDPNCKVEAYACESHESVASKISECETFAESIGTHSLRNDFQAAALGSNGAFVNKEEFFTKLNSFTEKLKNLTQESNCALEVFTQAISMKGQIELSGIFQDEVDENNENLQNFFQAVKELKEKIRNKNSLTNEILSEGFRSGEDD